MYKRKPNRVCPKCKENKATEYSSYCKPCASKVQLINTKKAGYKVAKKRIEQIRDLIKEAKSKPCLDCNISYPYFVMDLDHVKGIKEFSLGQAISKYRPISKIKEEIEKCEAICSNCHRIRTENRRLEKYMQVSPSGKASVLHTDIEQVRFL